MNTSGQQSTSPSGVEENRLFTLWALESIKLDVKDESDGVYSFEVPEDSRERFEGTDQVRFTFASADEQPIKLNDASLLRITPTSELFEWVTEQLKKSGKVVHAVPRDQADSVHEITPKLFECFQVDGGRVQLTGCSLVDRPFLRLTYRQYPSKGDRSQATLLHLLVDESGNEVDSEFRDALKMDELAPMTRRPDILKPAKLDEWLDTAARLANGRFDGFVFEPVVNTVVWCSFAEGKLALVIGNKSVATAFSGWTQLLADGAEKPPPHSCPLTGQSSYHLAATDDGRITVAEAIEVCCESGQRVLPSDLEECEATGKRALSKYFATCPVSGSRVMRTELVACSMCGQNVSPRAIQGNRCAACRSVKSVSPDEPRMARVLGEYPRLDRWRSWKINETADVYVLLATAIIKQIVLVVDKDSLEVRHLAAGSRFSRGWTEVPESLQVEYLG